MAEEKKNAQVTNGVNDDVTELKSLTTLRKRVISDGEIVTKAANGFRLANGNTGVMLRNDGKDFYALTTPNGQAQDGQWNTLRPFSFNLASGRVSLRNGVDISGGAMVSHNAGVSTATTGPTPRIAGQIYYSSAVESQFTSGNTTTTMLMSSRIVGNEQDYGLLSYRDMKGNWNELQIRSNAELNVGQITKRNPHGWFWAEGIVNKSNDERVTNGLHMQGQGSIYANLFLSERIRKHQAVELQVGDDVISGQFEFRNNGNAFTNGVWNSSSDARMKTDIEKIDGALEKLGKISGYTYLKQGVPEAGVIAQEVESVLPQSVTTTELKLNDGSVLKDARGININGVVALLVEALKEEREARRALETRLTVLEEAISTARSS